MIHSYGPEPDQYAELSLPEGDRRGVVVVIHGGFWRAAYDASLGRELAHDLCERGWVAYNIEYRRVGAGGGWPTTLQDVADAIDHLAELDLDLERVVTIGHSAGGHLALVGGRTPGPASCRPWCIAPGCRDGCCFPGRGPQSGRRSGAGCRRHGDPGPAGRHSRVRCPSATPGRIRWLGCHCPFPLSASTVVTTNRCRSSRVSPTWPPPRKPAASSNWWNATAATWHTWTLLQRPGLL